MNQTQQTATHTQEGFLERLTACKTSKDVAPVYADLIDATTLENANVHGLSIPKLNAYILSRWSTSTFKSIKQAAWKIADAQTRARHQALVKEAAC